MTCVSILADKPVDTACQRRLTICDYIDSCPQCSCSECEGIYVGREAGKILCCTMHMFTQEEIAAAKRKEPILVIKR